MIDSVPDRAPGRGRGRGFGRAFGEGGRGRGEGGRGRGRGGSSMRGRGELSFCIYSIYIFTSQNRMMAV